MEIVKTAATEYATYVMHGGLTFAASLNEVPFGNGSRLIFGKEGANLWRVLDYNARENKALIIAERCVCNRCYFEEFVPVSWAESSVRRWLNEEFYEENFSEEEKSAIISVDVHTPDNTRYKIEGGADTHDKVFLLSLDEAREFFTDEDDRATGDWWWLRTPGSFMTRAVISYSDGSLINEGYMVNREYGVRPAIFVDLSADVFKDFFVRSASGRLFSKQILFASKDGIVTWMNPSATINEIVLPQWVNWVGVGSFRDCKRLNRLSWENESTQVEINAFVNCPVLKLPARFYLGNMLPSEKLAQYAPDDPGIIAAGMLKGGSRSNYFTDAIEKLSASNASAVVESFLVQAKAFPGFINPERVLRLALCVSRAVSINQLEALCEIIRGCTSADERWISKLSRVIEAMRAAECEPHVEKELFNVSAEVFNTEDELLYGLPDLMSIFDATLGYAKTYGQDWVNIYDYKVGALKIYEKDSKADTKAEQIDHDAFMRLLDCWQESAGPGWYAPFAAFANKDELIELIERMKSWESDKNLHENIIRVRGAIMLNDSNFAMRYADEYELLEYYAAIRGMDEDTLRDSIMCNLGFDESGSRFFDVSGSRYELVLNRDLTSTLKDENGNVIDEITGDSPDAGFVIAKREIEELRNDIKPTAKNRNAKIFADFLSGKRILGNAWKKAYLKKPLLRILAELVVWDQDGKTFILHEDGLAYDVDGARYEITDAGISVAHPMEMGAEMTSRWQMYFADNNLKQPFEQVWEPVANAELIYPGHYDECAIPLSVLIDKKKHGIIMGEQSWITLKDCTATLILMKGNDDRAQNVFEIKDFRFDKFTRQVNHIVVYLDKITVEGRIRKNDISVMQWLDLFTMAQISEFIDIAVMSDAADVSALLMQYKNEHFGGFDLMDEFTLDLL